MRKATVIVAASTVMLLTQSASAVLVAGGDGTQNTTAPAGISGWNNVARVNGSSAVYLGNGWMITAAHVGSGSATFPSGSVYTRQTGTDVRLRNPDNSLTDLLMFRLSVVPSGLNPLTVSQSTPAANSTVYAMGYGRNRLPGEYEWTINFATDPDTWTEKPSTVGPADAAGYKYAAGNTLRWGTNTIESGVQQINSGFGVVHSLWSDFDNVSGEFQLVDNDSGGAMFLSNGTLVGILTARGTFSGQPADSAVYSPSNRSYAADLSVYQSQIAATIPEPSMILSAITVAGSALTLRRRQPA